MVSLPQQLQAQYGNKGIYAGKSHFRAYWARDNLFACFGALALKDYEQVRKSLDLFSESLQQGHVPLRIGYRSQIKAYLGMKTKEEIVDAEDKTEHQALDANSLLLIIAEKYEHMTLKKLDKEKLKAAIDWLTSKEQDHLLVEPACASWEDSLIFNATRLYNNVCYYRALVAASKLFKDPAYASKAVQTKIAIRRWWNGTYFMDGQARDVCMTAGNLLAILWGIADPQQSKKILEYMSSRKTIVPPASDKPAKKQEVHWFVKLIGLQQYHGTMEWSWLCGAEIACYHALGEHDIAYAKDTKLRELMERYGGIHEVYENDKPVKKLFYKSEENFAWALGVLIASQPSTLSLLR